MFVALRCLRISLIAISLLGLMPWAAYAGGPVNIDAFDLPPGKTVTVQFQVTVDSPMPPGDSSVSNQGVISGSNFSAINSNDPDTAAPNDATLTPIQILADLNIAKTDGVSWVVPGATVNYSIVVSNPGPSFATGITVLDTFPANLSGCTWSTTTSGAVSGHDPSGAGNINDTAIIMGPAASLTYTTANCLLSPGASGSLVNSATVTAATSDPNSANNSATDSNTIVPLNLVPPTVLALDDDANPGNGTIAACATVRRATRNLAVRFDEQLAASGSPGPDDANNPANYLLVTTGPDRDFSTTGCLGGRAGDDVAIAIDSVNYAINTPVAPQSTATLALNGGARLPPGLYRFFACGTTTLTDTDGNALDGNADGSAADDYVRGFRVDTGNLFDHGHYDCGMAGWSATGTGITYDAASDADASPRSGAVRMATAGNSSQKLDRCVGFGQLGPTEAAPYSLTGRARMQEITPSTLIGLNAECRFHSSFDCSGAPIGTEAPTGPLLSDSSGVWVSMMFGLNLPMGAHSATCGIALDNPLLESALIGIDQLRMEGVGILFYDGFDGLP